MTQMGMDRSKLTLVSTSFIGIKGKWVLVEGALTYIDN
jgi:hypothetical protein